MQSIVKTIRRGVSADKNRYLDGNFDLDLTYISDRIIAMSFPADGVESTYRNSIHEVSSMLNCRHFNHFMIFNLSEREYDYSVLNNMVLDWCGFPDHHAPPLALLCKIVRTLHAWLEADAKNVVVVHCLAGKGRTGTVIASYLIYAGLFNSASDAMNYFAIRRSNNSWGITGPSQKRYTQYFADMMFKHVVPRSNPVRLKMVIMHTIPQFSLAPMRAGICPILQVYSNSPQGGPPRLLFTSQEGRDNEEIRSFPSSNRSLAFHVNRIVRGDLLVVFQHLNAFYRMEQMLRCNFHTGMVPMPRLRLMKSELDGAEGDKRFEHNFFLDLVFEEIEGDMGPANHHIWDKAIELEQQTFLTKADTSSGSICFSPDIGQSTVEKIQQARILASNRGVMVGKSGWLTKKGHQVKNWKRRWFVLKDSSLSYYKAPKHTTPAGVIPINDIWRVVSDPEVSKREDMPMCFELITCKASNTAKIVTYVISAENDADREDWIQCIEAAMSSSFEVGRLLIDVIQAQFKVTAESEISHQTLYCTLGFGRQRFQTIVVPSIPAKFDQSAEFVVFEEPNELVVGLYMQDDVLLGSTTIDSAELQQQMAQVDANAPVDFWIPLITTAAAQKLQLEQLELHIKSKFHSSTDLVKSIHEMPTDMFDGSSEEFLIIPEKDKARTRSSSLGASATTNVRPRSASPRSSTITQPLKDLPETPATTSRDTNPSNDNAAASSVANGTTTSTEPPKTTNSATTSPTITPNSPTASPPPQTTSSNPISRMGLKTSVNNIFGRSPSNSSNSGNGNAGLRPYSNTISTPAITTWLGKLTTNILPQAKSANASPTTPSPGSSPSNSPSLTPTKSIPTATCNTNTNDNQYSNSPGIYPRQPQPQLDINGDGPPPRPRSPPPVADPPPSTPQFPPQFPPEYTAPAPPYEDTPPPRPAPFPPTTSKYTTSSQLIDLDWLLDSTCGAGVCRTEDHNHDTENNNNSTNDDHHHHNNNNQTTTETDERGEESTSSIVNSFDVISTNSGLDSNFFVV